MDKKYKELFTLITQNLANTAEMVMDLHKRNNDEKEYEIAQSMRDDYLVLKDKLDADETLNKMDYARLLVGAVIIVSQLENRIKSEQDALQGYKLDILPKLDQINNEIEEEKALQLAEQLFVIKETEIEKSDN